MAVLDQRDKVVRISLKAGVALVLVAGLSACTSTGVQEELTSCTFPDTTRTPAPSFICDQQLQGYPITRLTSAANTDLETDERIERARVDAQNELALEWLSNWFMDVPAEQENQARQVILDWLNSEFRVVRTRQSPSGTLYLLIGIAHSEVESQVILRRRFEAAGVETAGR
jgi:hypothetical protein